MGDLGITRREALWLTCKRKTCCYALTVVPTGRDIWRIARALDAPPWSFVRYFLTPAPRRDAFALDHSERRFRLVLSKRPNWRRKTTAPCIFLLRTRDGAHRCGLGELRPLVCRTYPADLVGGVVALREETPCTCRVWSLAELDLDEERALVEQRQRESEEYCAAVARWNALVEAAPPERTFTFLDYLAYLMASYDALASELAPGAEG